MSTVFDHLVRCPECSHSLLVVVYDTEISLFCGTHDYTRHIFRDPKLDTLLGTKLFEVLVLDFNEQPMTVVFRPNDLRELLSLANIRPDLIRWSE